MYKYASNLYVWLVYPIALYTLEAQLGYGLYMLCHLTKLVTLN